MVLLSCTSTHDEESRGAPRIRVGHVSFKERVERNALNSEGDAKEVDTCEFQVRMDLWKNEHLK